MIISVHSEQHRHIEALKRLLWVYIALAFLEGPLRKWLLPGLAEPLLIAREPFVLWMLFIAWKKRLFVGDPFLSVVGWLGFLTVMASLLVGGGLFSTAYGFRTNFLHVPVAILMARSFDKQDLLTFAKLALAFSLPHGVLMMVQFFSSPNSFINSGADNAFRQIGLSVGHIRPAGIFSYNTGASAYHAIVLALCLAPFGGRSLQYDSFRVAGLVGTGMAAVFSGSRGAWISYLIVVAVYVLASARYAPAQLMKKTPFLVVLLGLLPVALSLPRAATALDVFVSSRLNGDLTRNELIPRIFGMVVRPFEMAWDYPLLGHGLGIGTWAGAKLEGVGSIYRYGDAETELMRHTIESGAVLGGIYVLLRIWMTLKLFDMGRASAKAGDLTPLLMWAAVAPTLFIGQIGQSTTLAFVCLGAGLTLLAARLTSTTHEFSALRRQSPVEKLSPSPAFEGS